MIFLTKQNLAIHQATENRLIRFCCLSGHVLRPQQIAVFKDEIQFHESFERMSVINGVCSCRGMVTRDVCGDTAFGFWIFDEELDAFLAASKLGGLDAEFGTLAALGLASDSTLVKEFFKQAKEKTGQ